MVIKRFLFTAIVCVFSVYVQASDSLSVAYKRIDNLEQRLKQEIASRENVQKALEKAETKLFAQDSVIESLSKEVRSSTDDMGAQIKLTNVSLNSKANSDDVETKVIWGSVFLLVIAIIGVVFYILLHKRINKGVEDIYALKAESDKLNEKILNQFAQEMSEMQKISTSLDALAKVGGSSSEPDHSLIKTLADRITFMEMTLYKMDSTVRGHKHLSRSIKQMKDNLLANGYELVDMLGKPYNDGMKVTANFIEDETLEKGQQIITGIIKPQINYKGIMIQSAQITVSQN